MPYAGQYESPTYQWVNVRTSPYYAKGDGVTDDTLAIQGAIDAAKKEVAGGGVVYFPPGVYIISSALKVTSYITLKGAGGLGQSGDCASEIAQKVGTADVFLKNGNPAITLSGLLIEDLHFSSFNNQAANTGGINLVATQYSVLNRVQVSYAKTYAFAIRGGGSAGDAMRNRWEGCVANNTQTGGTGWYLEGTATSQPDGNTCINCHVNGGTTGFKIRSNGSPDWIDSFVMMACQTQEVATPFDSDGKWAHVMGCRFERVGGGAIAILLSSGAPAEPTGQFVANEYATPTLTWTDTAAVKSPRFETQANGSSRAQFSGASFTPSGVISQYNPILLTQNLTMNAPTNPIVGEQLWFTFYQQAPGNFTVTWNPIYKTVFQPGPDPGRNTTIGFWYDGTNYIAMGGIAIEDNGYADIPGGLTVRGAYVYAQGGVFLGSASGGHAFWRAAGATGRHEWQSNNGVIIQGTLDSTGNLSTKAAMLPGTPAAAIQTAVGLFAGTGAPNNAQGTDGCIYFRSDGAALTTIYQRRAGAWVGIV